MKKPWVLVAANATVALLVLLFLFAILTALGAMAASVTTWPLFILLSFGLVISVFTIRAVGTIDRRKVRLFATLVNGCALTLYLLVAGVISWTFLTETRERFILPEGYEGEVYVVHSVPGGVPEERSFYRTRTYRISNDGVLLSQVPMEQGWTRPEYYYEAKNGKLTKITNAWYSTIQSTPENLANNSDVGMYFPRTASGPDKSGCSGSADLFEIGTPSYLLTSHKRIDLSDYLAKHADACVKK